MRLNPKLVLAGGVVLPAVLFGWMVSRETRPAPVAAEAEHPPARATAAPAPQTSPAPAVATHAPEPRPRETAPGEIVGSAWATHPQPEHARFRAWVQRYEAAPPAARVALEAEGAALASARRRALAGLIREDPRTALSLAVPDSARRLLPPAIRALLEEHVSGIAELAVIVSAPPEPALAAAPEPWRRSALIGRREFRAHVYGRRARQTTLERTSLVGIALDRDLAVSDGVFRRREAAEIDAADRAESRAIPGADAPHSAAATASAPAAWLDCDGASHRVCCAEHVAALERELLALELPSPRIDGDIPGPGVEFSRPAESWTHGPKTLLVIRVDFPDLPGTPGSGDVPIDAALIDSVINDAGGVRDFYTENSAGKSTIVLRPPVGGVSPDVTPVLRMSITAADFASQGSLSLLQSLAREAAVGAGYAVDAYDRIAFVHPNVATLPGSLVVRRGQSQLVGKHFFLNGEFSFYLVAHELGHTYGVVHSSAWQVADGNPLSPDGLWVEYGDLHDVMGSGLSRSHHFNHRQKHILRWIPDEAVLAPSADGIYRIHRSDGIGPNLALPRVLKLRRDSERDYWLGYRRGTTSASLNHGLSALLCPWEVQSVATLNLNPPHTDFYEPGLAIDSNFADSAAGVSIMPVAQGGSGADEWIDVRVDFAPFQPKVRWSRAQWYFDEQGGHAELSLSRTDSARGAFTVGYTTQAGTAVAPANFSARAGLVSWADGDAADKTITIALSPDTLAEGLENFTVTLAPPAGGLLGGSAVTTVNIADAGVRDPRFNATYSTSQVRCILPLPDGSILFGGRFVNAPPGGSADVNRRGILRVSATGAPNPGFGGGVAAFANEGPAGSPGAVHALALQPDGRILVAGEFTSFTGIPRSRILRLLADGTLDTSFDPGAGANAAIHAVLLQPDGRILIGGEFTSYGGSPRRHLARLNADGTRDADFTGPDFATTAGSGVRTLARQSDGKILAGGNFTFAGRPARSGLCRLLNSGTPDAGFDGLLDGAHAAGDTGAGRTVLALAVQPDGRILVAGDFSAFNGAPRGGLARLEANGALDASFTPTSDGACHAVALRADGRILVGGTFTQFNSIARRNLVRLTAAGALDPVYTADYDGTVTALAAWTEERVLFGGDPAGFQGIAIKRPVWSVFAAARTTAAIQSQPRGKAVRVGARVSLATVAVGEPPLTFQWFRDGVSIPGATTSALTLEAAQFSDAGSYTVQIANPSGTTTSEVALVDVRPRALRLAGISTRAQVGTGGDIQIGGFAISGTVPKKVVVRAGGPALAGYGVPGTLADPVLSLYSGVTRLAQNDDWAAGDAAEFSRLGMAAWTPGSGDAALVTTLPPGAYTAQVAGKSGGTGVALVEIYDADDPAAAGQLTGISTRALVGSNSAVLIGGFAIESDAPKRVIVRASGPALAPYGVGGVLADPVLTIYSGETAIATNDDWNDALAADFAAVGMFAWPAGSKDAALAITLPPGAYTAQISGKNGATGVALIEIYED